MFSRYQNEENYFFQVWFLFYFVVVTNMWTFEAFQSSESIYFFQHGWPEWESNSQPGSAVVMLYQNQHTTLTHCWTSDPCFYSKVESCFFVCVWVFCFTQFDSGLYIWLTVICFVSWWWGPVIDGRGPGHLRSTAVDSSEIESSSRSVTMSSLRSWLGRQPSKPQHWGGLHELQLGPQMWVHMEIVLGWRERD